MNFDIKLKDVEKITISISINFYIYLNITEIIFPYAAIPARSVDAGAITCNFIQRITIRST